MTRIHNSTNRIRFSDIPEKYAIPRQYKAKQSDVHSAVVTYVFEHYKDTKKYRQKVVDALNCLTYCILNDNPPPFNWVATNPLDTMPDMEMDEVENTLSDFFLTPDSIDWDVAPVADIITESDVTTRTLVASENEKSTKLDNIAVPIKPASNSESIITNRPLHQIKVQQQRSNKSSSTPTPKEDLYIQPPRCPRFDVNKIWMSADIGSDHLVIYTTLPEIPTRQNEISITTDVNQMLDPELMTLYPNHVIHTRDPKLYEQYDGVDYDEDLGCIFPINGFTREQLVDNIIRYPHLYKLRKIGPDGSISKFFSTLELDGELYPIEDIWDSLPESKQIPRIPEFVKEYVIRRYLLEEQEGIRHKYRILGSLDPFLTLFMPASKYAERGYSDVLSIVKQCVISRVSYKQTRSPILRRIEQNV